MLRAARRLLVVRGIPVVPCDSYPCPLFGMSNNALIGRNFTSVSAAAGTSPSISVDFSIFKRKAALTTKPSLPKFTRKDSGLLVINRGGSVMLTFMPSIGVQKYDWEKRQIFALSPTEVGCLINLGPGESCDFLHDPSMKSSLEGQVKKSLSVKPLASDDGGYLISLTVNNNSLKTSDHLSLPVSKAEFSVMRTSFGFILPYIMGWDRAVKQQSTTFPELVAPQRNFESTTTSHLVAPQRNSVLHDPHAEWCR